MGRYWTMRRVMSHDSSCRYFPSSFLVQLTKTAREDIENYSPLSSIHEPQLTHYVAPPTHTSHWHGTVDSYWWCHSPGLFLFQCYWLSGYCLRNGEFRGVAYLDSLSFLTFIAITRFFHGPPSFTLISFSFVHVSSNSCHFLLLYGLVLVL